MTFDEVLLLVGVNAAVLAIIAISVWVLIPVAVGSKGNVQSLEDLPGIRTALLDVFKSLAVKLSSASSGERLQRRLDIAGNPKGWSVERIYVAKGMTAVLFGFSTAIFGTIWIGSLFSLKVVVLTTLISAFGFVLPNILLFNVGEKRQKKIQEDLPDVLDLLIVSMQAGLAFDSAVMKVVTNGSGPLSLEFARMLQEARLGVGRGDALRKLSERSTVSDLNHVIQALVQADALGIPVANVLHQQGQEMRVKRRQRAEEKAQKVPIKVLFPTIVCIFPALLVVVGGPAAIKIAGMFS